MKKIIAALLALIAIISLIGCERLPEEPEPTATPRATTPEPRDYYSDTAEETPEPEESEAPEGEEDEDGEEAVETSEESEEDEDDSDSTFSYTRRTREEIEAEIMQGVEKDETDTRLGSDLARPYRMLPPADGWRGAYGGVVRREEPVGEAPVVVAPEPEPEPTPNIPIIIEGNVGNEPPKAYIEDGVPMLPLNEVMDELSVRAPDGGTRMVLSYKDDIAILDLVAGTISFEGNINYLSVPPYYLEDKWYVSIDLFSIFPKAGINYDGTTVNIKQPTEPLVEPIPAPAPPAPPDDGEGEEGH